MELAAHQIKLSNVAIRPEKMRITRDVLDEKNNAAEVLLPRWRTWAVSRFTKCVYYQVKKSALLNPIHSGDAGLNA